MPGAWTAVRRRASETADHAPIAAIPRSGRLGKRSNVGGSDGAAREGIATIMREDGVVGHHGLAPNGKSVRRV
jgi:hypothetical protein